MVGEACTDAHPLPRAPMPRSARCRYGRNRRHRSDPFLPLSPQQQPQCRNGTRSPIWLNGEHTWLGRINVARRWLTLSHAQLSLLSYVAGRNSCAGNVLRLATSARPVTRSARAVPLATSARGHSVRRRSPALLVPNPTRPCLTILIPREHVAPYWRIQRSAVHVGLLLISRWLPAPQAPDVRMRRAARPRGSLVRRGL
jgi:hypothetical protein